MNKGYWWCLLCWLPFCGVAQEEGLRNHDYVYLDNLYSVQLQRTDSLLGQPIIPLNSVIKLRLSFDDLDPEVKDYIYTLTHCDINWQPSDIDELDYIDGFTENDVQEYRFSYNTIKEYTHYELLLPNEDVRWTKSGNYLLKVYEDEGERRLALTRRFVVYERLMGIEGRFFRPANPEYSSTHQELDFTVSHNNIRIGNPHEEINAVVLQNGRWDNALLNIKPKFIRNEKLVYDHQGKIIFPAGKEFRRLDLRSFDFRTGRIAEIEEYDEEYEVYLKTEKPRPYRPYIYHGDLNGRYIVENLDVNRQFGRTSHVDIVDSYNQREDEEEDEKTPEELEREREAHALQGDYGLAHFSLKSVIPFEGKKVYLFGELTDWQLQDKYELQYNNETNSYEGEALLKQGYYNYYYALSDTEKPGAIELSETEGHWHETENDYTVLIYWRPFGQRYDRVVAVKTFNSVRGQ